MKCLVSRFRRLPLRNQQDRTTHAPTTRCQRELQVEGLERRELLAVSSLWMSGDRLVVKADNSSTRVEVSQVGGNLLVDELGTPDSWSYGLSGIGSLEFQGGSGNDEFINLVSNLSIRAFGGAGNDWLQGFNAADELIGGAGRDTLIGLGGNDRLWGGDGNDLLRGGAGDDRLMGDADQDQLEGDAGNDFRSKRARISLAPACQRRFGDQH